MKIHDYYYDQDNCSLYVEFSTKKDGEDFYRKIDLPYSEIELYATTIISKYDMDDIDEIFIKELLEQYFKENDLPEQQVL